MKTTINNMLFALCLVFLVVSCSKSPQSKIVGEPRVTDQTGSLAVAAQDIGFTCEAKGYDEYVWKYEFEIDKNTSKGVQRGVTFGGYPYSQDIEVIFTPERMQIRDLGAVKFTGYIDRRDLSFFFGGAQGFCKQKTVSKQDTKF